MSFSATAAREKPLFDIPIDALSKGGAHRIIVIDRSRVLIASMVFAFLLVLVWAYPRLARRYKQARKAVVAARKRYAEGEAPAWRVLRWMDKSPDFKHPARVDKLDSSADPGLGALTDTIATHYSGRPDAKLNWNEAEGALRRTAKRARKKRETQSPLPPLNRY